VGEPGRLAPHDPDPRSTVAPRRQLLHAPVVQAGRRRPPVLNEQLGEVTAGAEGGGQDALDDGFFDLDHFCGGSLLDDLFAIVRGVRA
jgi:hypothetical protein